MKTLYLVTSQLEIVFSNTHEGSRINSLNPKTVSNLAYGLFNFNRNASV
jgi:hypothetical protein